MAETNRMSNAGGLQWRSIMRRQPFNDHFDEKMFTMKPPTPQKELAAIRFRRRGGVAAGFAKVVAGSGPLAVWIWFIAGAAAVADWPVPRGNAHSSGSTDDRLPETLRLRWELKFDEPLESTPVIAGDRLFLTDVMGSVHAVDLGDDRAVKRWSRNLDVGFASSPSVLPTGESSATGESSSTGESLSTIGASGTESTDPSGAAVVVGDVEGTVTCLDAGDGDVRWQREVGGEIDASPAFHGDTVLVTSQDGSLTAMSIGDGEVRWTYETDDQLRCGATIVDGRTYLGGCDANLHRVDVNDGSSAGDSITIDGPTGSTPAATAYGFLVLPIMSGMVYGVGPGGDVQWKYEDAERAQEYRTDAAVDDSIAVVVSARRNVDALSIATGQRQWRYTLRRRANASPVIAGDDVWIAGSDGRLIRLDKTTGREKWVYEVRGSFVAAPAITGGRLYIGDDKGVLRCFGGE